MAKYNKKTALQIIVNAAKEYDLKLNNKHFMIVYQEGRRIETVYVGFRDMNFLHMTGVSSRLSAQHFIRLVSMENFPKMILRLTIKEKYNKN